ncbi:MAG: P1 family peptidase [Actinomycetes bacterium]
MSAFLPPQDGPTGPGATNSLTDVPGLRVGHASVLGDGWLTGTTVVLASSSGAVGGVDVRGGGPGTRETDLLDPRSLVERVHAVVLSGGSAFGLASVDGVLERLADAGIGLPVGEHPGDVVPIVPAAIIFDLGRGGQFRHHPTARMGQAAYDAAAAPEGSGPVPQGCVGAGTGAVAGGLKGAVGSASVLLPSGHIVGALAVVNAVGSTVDPRTGLLYAAASGLGTEFDLAPRRAHPPLAPPSPPEAPRVSRLNTTVGVVATGADLTKAQCTKLAEAAHDGMARAIRPAHTMFDGDTVFGLSTGDGSHPVDPVGLNQLLAAAADCFARAIGHAMLAATTTQTPVGTWRSYADTHLTAL